MISAARRCGLWLAVIVANTRAPTRLLLQQLSGILSGDAVSSVECGIFMITGSSSDGDQSSSWSTPDRHSSSRGTSGTCSGSSRWRSTKCSGMKRNCRRHTRNSHTRSSNLRKLRTPGSGFIRVKQTMRVTMSSSDSKDQEQQQQQQQPTFVIAAPQAKVEAGGVKSRLTRKHVLIAIVSLLVATVIVVGVVVSVHLYTDSSVEVLKYQLKMKDKDNQDVEQDVSTDANSVQYHVVKEGVEAWILQDFDKDVEVSKVKTDNGVNCYIAALNRSNAQEPSSIPSTAPTPDDDTPSTQLIYTVNEHPVKDISFLGNRASKLCTNIPTYWMVPSCGGGGDTFPTNGSAVSEHEDGGRSKRATVCATCGGYYCVCGCCAYVCGSFASSRYTWYYANGYYHCTYRMYHVSCYAGLASTNCYFGRRRYYYP